VAELAYAAALSSGGAPYRGAPRTGSNALGSTIRPPAQREAVQRERQTAKNDQSEGPPRPQGREASAERRAEASVQAPTQDEAGEAQEPEGYLGRGT